MRAEAEAAAGEEAAPRDLRKKKNLQKFLMGFDGNLKMKTRQAVDQLAPWPAEDEELARQELTSDLIRQF